MAQVIFNVSLIAMGSILIGANTTASIGFAVFLIAFAFYREI